MEFEQKIQDCITCSARSLRIRVVTVTSCWKAVAVFAHSVCKSQSRVVLATGPQALHTEVSSCSYADRFLGGVYDIEFARVGPKGVASP